MSKHGKSFEILNENGKGLIPVLQVKRAKFACPSSSKLMIKADSQGVKEKNEKIQLSTDVQIRSAAILNSISPNRISSRSPGSQMIDLKLRREKRLLKNNSLSKSFYEVREMLNEKERNEGKILLFKLKEKIRKAKGNCLELFTVFQDIFEEVIEKDLNFTAVLMEVKEGYEDYIKKIQDSQKIRSLEDQVKDLQSQIFNLNEESRSFERNLDRISKENLQLSKDLDRSEEICTELQRKLCKITLFELSNCPKDDLTWKSLVSENQTLYQNFLKQGEELSSFQYKEKKLFQLITALKQRGFPVEEVYQSEIVKKKHSTPSSPSSSSSENENLLSSRPLIPRKPSIIPLLSLRLCMADSIEDF
jgi:hypothetical protein